MIESPTRIEPCAFEEMPLPLAAMAGDLRRAVTGLGLGLHPDTVAALVPVVRLANAYFSHLIEGISADPEKAAAASLAPFPPDARPADLAVAAHVLLQEKIDAAGITDRNPASRAMLKWMHREMFAAGAEGRNVPGRFRSEPADDVVVGRHHPPSSAAVEAFMGYFEEKFAPARLTAGAAPVGIAIAHHRFGYVHPFPDGNGRVDRQMTHVMLRNAGMAGQGLWAVSRALQVQRPGRPTYHQIMDVGDTPRRGDLDGRGNLSTSALLQYCGWFLEAMMAEINFSQSMLNAGRLRQRYADVLIGTGFDERTRDIALRAFDGGVFAAAAPEYASSFHQSSIRNLLRQGFLLPVATAPGRVGIGFPLRHRARLLPRLFDPDAPLE